jgi:biotin synthase
MKQNWQISEVVNLFALPFNDLLLTAQTVHRKYWDANAVQASTLLSIKTGGCVEDCSYCPQSAKYDTGLKAGKLMPLDEVVAAAKMRRRRVHRASVWVRRGANQKSAIWQPSLRWCAR